MTLLGAAEWPLVAAGPAPGTGFRTFIPQWTKGMHWTLETEYRLHSGGVPGPRQRDSAWSAPVTWRFKVMEVAKDRNLDVIRVRAEETSKSGHGAAGFFFLGERTSPTALRGLSLARAAYRPAGQSGEPESIDYTTRATAPFPVLNELSLVPGDFPAFGPEETFKGREQTESFEVTESEGSLHFALDVRQVIRRVEASAGDPRIRVPVPPGAEILEYTATRRADGAGFRQLWTRGIPWYLYCETGSMKAWLVEPR